MGSLPTLRAYSFRADQQTWINPSPVGFVVAGKPVHAALASVAQRSVNSVWKPVWGKRAIVPEQFNEATLDLTGFRLVARAYDDGVAFRYETLPAGATNERTRFNFAGDYTAWFYNGEQPNLGPEKLSASDGNRRPVMTLKASDTAYLAVHEADLVAGDPLLLASQLGDTSFRIASRPSTAWRVIL